LKSQYRCFCFIARFLTKVRETSYAALGSCVRVVKRLPRVLPEYLSRSSEPDSFPDRWGLIALLLEAASVVRERLSGWLQR
jgi:hypothetical protein